MKSRGFYTTSKPVDASYSDQLVLHIAMPRGSDDLRKRIMTGLIFVLGACGITHSGDSKPAEALAMHEQLNERKERAS